ncbi:MAG: glycoside hydrolase family 3 N-terminal domain-containing protein [Bacteroidota bacterium]
MQTEQQEMTIIKPFFSVFLILMVFYGSLMGQQADNEFAGWAKDVFEEMTLEEKIGQLFIIRAHSDKSRSYHEHVGRTIKDFHVGGVCFFQGGPGRQAALVNEYQELSDIPLFVAQDAEWGLGMRLDSTISFPRQMTLGALRDNGLIYDMGEQIARHLKHVGVNMNFAPVVDVNSNPENPVINSRSFGEVPRDVGEKASMYVYGLQDNGVIATAKHFPGHGDTDTDSHKTLPVIHHDRQRIDSTDLVPFQSAIKDGVSGIMAAHLHIPALDSAKDRASTLSKPIITKLLQKDMGFNGLVITDALEMTGVTENNQPGQLELEALKAGNDILLMPVNIRKAVKRIKNAVASGEITEGEIDRKVKKILKYKQLYNIHRTSPVNTASLQKHLHNENAKSVIRKIAREAITVVHNRKGIVPLKRIDTMKIASVASGVENEQVFQRFMNHYADITHFQVPKDVTDTKQNQLLEELEDFDLILFSVHNTSSFPFRNFGISSEEQALADTLAKIKPVVFNVFGIPYALNKFKNLQKFEAVLLSYEDRDEMQQAAAQALFGGIALKGRLPVSLDEYPVHHGLETPKIRMSFDDFFDIGIKNKYIRKIDSIASDGIEQKAYPGCQILMAKDGRIFYNKTFGTHTYDENHKVKKNDLYDLASLTKIAASTLSVMKLQEDSLINIDRRLSYYLPFLRHTNKSEIIVRDVMAHQAGLQSWIPYYVNTILDEEPDSVIYRNHLTEDYSVRVAGDLYIHKDYKHQIFDTIATSPLREQHDYKYSDLGFYLLYRAIELVTNQPFEKYVDQTFYKPLGLQTIQFLPAYHVPEKRLVPTEDDQAFRKQLLRGDVHDPGAAMLGGVSGHAGLFSNAYDMAVLMQMLLDNGTYGGRRFFNPQTIHEFTKTQFPLDDNRRGIGFDKPVIDGEDNGPTCQDASSSSFGHSGFTGTYAWADPENGTVYIFLSNRIHPDASNRKLISMDIRTKIQQVMYDAVKDIQLQ